jgi:hypothetical protein
MILMRAFFQRALGKKQLSTHTHLGAARSAYRTVTRSLALIRLHCTHTGKGDDKEKIQCALWRWRPSVVWFAFQHVRVCSGYVLVWVRKTDIQTDGQSLTRGRQEVINHLQERLFLFASL